MKGIYLLVILYVWKMKMVVLPPMANILFKNKSTVFIFPLIHITHHDLQYVDTGMKAMMSRLVHLLFSLLSGMEGIECSLPPDGRRVPLSLLSEDSFRECRGTLTLTDYLIVIFSGISVSVAAIMASFFLASTVHCFQRLSKGNKGDEEEGNDWGKGKGK